MWVLGLVFSYGRVRLRVVFFGRIYGYWLEGFFFESRVGFCFVNFLIALFNFIGNRFSKGGIYLELGGYLEGV